MKQKLKSVQEPQPETGSKHHVLVSSLLQDYEIDTVSEQGSFVTLEDQGKFIHRMLEDTVTDTATVFRSESGALVTLPAVVGG